MSSNDHFIEALHIPAFLSTIKKIQYDCGYSLCVLQGYYQTQKYRKAYNYELLTESQKKALMFIYRTTIKQGIDSAAFFVAVKVAVLSGGILAGQAAQICVSVNHMTAANKQHVSPAKMMFGEDRLSNLCEQIPWNERTQSIIAYTLGSCAERMGYHGLSDNLANHGRISTVTISDVDIRNTIPICLRFSSNKG